MADPASSAPPDVSLASQLSRAVVRTVSEYTGRGPTSAHTTINGDTIVTLLRDTLTKGERSLVADGRSHLVLDMRKAFQETMAEVMTQRVEEIVGRPVIAFMSDNTIEPDMSVEVFVPGPAATS
jgi:uncharacterized protein YbcI